MLIEITPAATEPMDALEARLRMQLQLDPAETEENDLIDGMCAAARAQVEDLTGRRLITQTVGLVLAGFPGAALRLPVAPVTAVSAIRYTAPNAVQTVLDPAAYRLTRAGGLCGIAPALDGQWPDMHPEGEVEIDLAVGYGAALADVPPPLAQAMRLIVAHLFANRNAVSGAPLSELPLGVRDLCAPFRVWA